MLSLSGGEKLHDFFGILPTLDEIPLSLFSNKKTRKQLLKYSKMFKVQVLPSYICPLSTVQYIRAKCLRKFKFEIFKAVKPIVVSYGCIAQQKVQKYLFFTENKKFLSQSFG